MRNLDPTPRFYVYALCRPCGTPFYIGKGCRKEAWSYQRAVKSGKSGFNARRYDTILDIWAGEEEVVVEFVLEDVPEREAFAYERECIALIGRVILTNMTRGGEGQSGWNPTVKQCENISIGVRRFWSSEEGRKVMLDRFTPEVRQRQSDGLKRFYASPRGQETLRGKYTPEVRQKMSDSHTGTTGKYHSEATRQKLSIAAQNRPAPSVEARWAMGSSFRGKNHGTEHVVKRLESLSNYYANWTDEDKVIRGEAIRRGRAEAKTKRLELTK